MQSVRVAVEKIDEIPVAETGTIKGQLPTTDNKPATEVTVSIKGINRYAVTTLLRQDKLLER